MTHAHAERLADMHFFLAKQPAMCRIAVLDLGAGYLCGFKGKLSKEAQRTIRIPAWRSALVEAVNS